MFSIIIPLYNKEKYIRRCIISVINQSFINFELIIVDDASSDNSLQIAKNIKDERITIYVRNKRGYGGYAARNFGIKKAKYNYIAFLDADDEWTSEHLLEINNLIKKYPDTRAFSSGWFLKSKNIKKTDSYSLSLDQKKSHKISEFYTEAAKGKSPIYTSVAVFHKTIFADAGYFPDGKCKKGGDIELWLRCMQHSELAHTGKITVIYYKDDISAVTKSISDTEIPYVFFSVEKLLKTEKNIHKQTVLKKYANYYSKISIFHSIVFNKNKKELIKCLYKDIDKRTYSFFKFIMIFPPFILIPLYRFYRFLKVKLSRSDLG